MIYPKLNVQHRWQRLGIIPLLVLSATCWGCEEQPAREQPLSELPKFGKTDAYYGAWNHDESEIVYLGINPLTGIESTMILDTETGESRMLTQQIIFGAEFNADGTQVVGFTDETDANIILIKTDGTDEKRLTGDGTLNSRYRQFDMKPSFSPNGTKIVYGATGAMGVPRGIYIMDIDGSNSIMVTPIHLEAKWYSQNQLYVHVYVKKSDETYSDGFSKFDLESNTFGEIVRIDQTATEFYLDRVTDFDLSPDNRRVVFIAFNLFLLDLETQELECVFLLEKNLSLEKPMFDSKGDRILFSIRTRIEPGILTLNTLMILDLTKRTVEPVFRP